MKMDNGSSDCPLLISYIAVITCHSADTAEAAPPPWSSPDTQDMLLGWRTGRSDCSYFATHSGTQGS